MTLNDNNEKETLASLISIDYLIHISWLIIETSVPNTSSRIFAFILLLVWEAANGPIHPFVGHIVEQLLPRRNQETNKEAKGLLKRILVIKYTWFEVISLFCNPMLQ